MFCFSVHSNIEVNGEVNGEVDIGGNLMKSLSFDSAVPATAVLDNHVARDKKAIMNHSRAKPSRSNTPLSQTLPIDLNVSVGSSGGGSSGGASVFETSVEERGLGERTLSAPLAAPDKVKFKSEVNVSEVT